MFQSIDYFIMKSKRWNDQQLKEAVVSSTSIRQILKKLGLVEAGGNYRQIKERISFLNINCDHFKGKGWSKGKKGIGSPRLKLEDILVINSNFQSFKLKKRLFSAKLKSVKCELCGWAEKSIDGRIPLELDHINGNSHDNRINNLRILCPNCHSLQPTHRGKNKFKKTNWPGW